MNDLKFQYHFTNKTKRITIRIKSKNLVKISAPEHINKDFLNQFIYSKQNWIIDKISEIETVNRSMIYFNENSLTIPFLNQEYFIKKYKGKNNFREDGNIIHIWVPDLTKSHVKKILRKWIEKKILKEIEKEVFIISKKLNKLPRKILLKNYSARWGACTSQGDLIFNWQIAFLKKDQFKYIVAHEMCHLIEMNHSVRFYKLLKELGIDVKKINKELKFQKNLF